MKLIFILTALFMLTVSADKCNEKKAGEAKVYKGRLEIKAICMNYTIKLLEGNIDSSRIVGHWTDETTNRSYHNVFALENPCSFPATIKQGDEFNFIIDSSKTAPCAVCMAYYPVPGKKLSIKIIDK